MRVIKIGGAAGIGIDGLVEDLARSWRAGDRQVLVHGGSDETNRLSEELGHPAQFLTSPSGHTSRRTDARTLQIFVMATALVNRRIVARLQSAGVDALGISGVDGGLLRARRKDVLRVIENGRQRIIRDDWTGRVESVSAITLTRILSMGMLPVVAPLALGREHETLNIDGDRGAAAIAAALKAQSLIILSNVPGILKSFPDEDSLVRQADLEDMASLKQMCRGRMSKKVLAAEEALTSGVREVVISDARRDRPLTSAVNGAGTVIYAQPWPVHAASRQG